MEWDRARSNSSRIAWIGAVGTAFAVLILLYMAGSLVAWRAWTLVFGSLAAV